MDMKNILILLILLFTKTIFSQFKFEKKDEIVVKYGNKALNFPWEGGLNFVQFSEIDFDFDGDMDLFIFDRTKDNIRLFENVLENGTRKYKSVYNPYRFFPENLRYRVALLDYNNDGKNDIFTYAAGGVRVYKNVGNPIEGLKWELATNLIRSDYNGNNSNLFISSSDIPAYVDVDFDGDIDVLTFDISGERVEYHKNMSKELYNHSDSLVFKLRNECWGGFKEDPANFNVFLNSQTYPCVGSPIINPEAPLAPNDKDKDSISISPRRHAGSTLLGIDINNNGVMDLILGDVSSSHLNLLINGGTSPNTNSKMISQDQNFPSNTVPVELDVYPAAFYLDVDFDGIKDLIVGANAKNSSQNVSSILFYKNFGTNQLPNFVFQTNAFLQEEMIDVGSGAIPVFFDQNNDDLEDLIIANFFRYKVPFLKESNFNHYRNIGTAEEPIYNFIEANYLNITNLNLGLRIVPTFGDIDGDGKKDLFLGLENGTLTYLKNISTTNEAQFGTPISFYKDANDNMIHVGSYAFPQLFDINNDGLLDLLIGNRTGEIFYYKNVGTTNNPSFQLENQLLGGIDLAPSSPDGYSSPHFFRHLDTTYLLLGGMNGNLHFYKDIDGKLGIGDSFSLVSNFFREINVESFSSCWVNDIDNDGNLDLFVGGELGGIYHYEHNENSTLSLTNESKISQKIEVYPNPFKNEIIVNYNSFFQYSLIDLSGKISVSGDSSGKIFTNEVSKGFYILNIFTETTTFQFKLIKE
jgi:hypothetical protein